MNELIKRTDEGISGVVGVMLLLTLTLIAAAIVAAAAVGASNTSHPAPTLSADAHFAKSGDEIYLVFEHNGGDILVCSDIKVTAFLIGEDGSEFSKSFMLDSLTGENLWSAGNMIKTSGSLQTANCLGLSVSELKTESGRSAPVTIKMFHVPSSTVVFQKSILLEDSK